MSNAFIQAAIIILREGLEALLVLAALAAYLVKADASHRLRELYIGAGIAVLASIVGAWAFAMFNSGAHSDTLEAIVIFAAAGLMLYVSGWLLIRQDPRVWQRYLATQAQNALSRETRLAIAGLAFLAVFREGAETVLFINALATTAGGWTAGLLAGVGVAFVGLAVLFYFINVIAQRVPLRPLFIVTSAFLFLMAVKFIGEGIQELQEQAIVSVTDVANSGLLTALGLNATWEALMAQGAVIVLAIATYIVMSRRAAQAALKAV